MTIKKQLKTLKDNWLLATVGVVFILLLLSVGSIGNVVSNTASKAYYGGVGMSEQSMAYDMVDSRIAYYPGTSSYYPEIESRIIIKSASMSIETKTNEFDSTQNKLKNIVSSYDADITSEYVNTNGKGIGAYQSGSFTIKVATTQYGEMVDELQNLGEVTSFNENARDVTENYVDTQTQLELAQEKLARYQSLYDEAESIEDKINLEDRITSQEYQIKYLEEQLKNTDTRVEYTTVSVDLREKQSSFANISLLKFGDWVRNLVHSLNALLYLIAWVIPFAIAIGIIVFIKRRL